MRRRIELSNLDDVSDVYASPVEALEQAGWLIEHALDTAQFPASRLIQMKMRRDLLYFIKQLDAPGTTQILLNRQYKPLGSTIAGTIYSVRYENYPQLHVHLTQAQIIEASTWPGSSALFHDGTQPWLARREAEAYLRRLRRLYELVDATV